MPDVVLVGGASLAGSLAAFGVLVAVGNGPGVAIPNRSAARFLAGTAWIARREGWRRLDEVIDRAGLTWSSRQVAIATGAVAAGLGILTLALGLVFVPFGFAAGFGLSMSALRSSAERRRRRLESELVPLLELFTLELSAGGSALSALGSVTVQVEGELAADLRRMLIASQVTGSASFETRLIAYSERVRIPALGSLATILGASREFGTGTLQGVRALATDLRRGQRRELISRSRKALNHVLLPAAFGVLLPFLGILMFPAISVLQRSLR